MVKRAVVSKKRSKKRARELDKVDTLTPKKTRRNWKATFLRAFRESANVRAACEKAKISRQAAYDAYKSDEGFAAQWDAAEEDACDLLELEARRRAYEGTDKPITFHGVVHATYKEYSDTLLMFLLKAHRPHKFSERVRQEQSGEIRLRVVYDSELVGTGTDGAVAEPGETPEAA